MGADVDGRVDNDSADTIGVETFDLLCVGAESKKQKAEDEYVFFHL